MKKNDFFEKKVNFFLGGDGMAGVSAGKWANYEVGTRGGAVALLSGFFRGGDGKGSIFGAVAQVGKSA